MVSVALPTCFWAQLATALVPGAVLFDLANRLGVSFLCGSCGFLGQSPRGNWFQACVVIALLSCGAQQAAISPRSVSRPCTQGVVCVSA